jgi:hypothetical protein
VRWDPSTDDLGPQQFIRYDVYVNGQLQAVVVGTTSAEVELVRGETSVITVIAVDTADNASAPTSITVSAFLTRKKPFACSLQRWGRISIEGPRLPCPPALQLADDSASSDTHFTGT